ncbi:MAG TPA: RagB/SusD family nutrient uptake outer membrane protein, partial [Bacteroidales bacterium]|nr:RagB/SusD family nutrient uptake outer membrane protein [Bacteroidales bacterium]
DAVIAILTDNHTHNFYTSLIDDNVGNPPASSPAAWEFTSTWTEDQAAVDPRLDWSVGRKGIPYWDWGIVTGVDWVRDASYGGVYSPKKQVYKKEQKNVWTEVGNWTSGWTSNGYRMIRYADLLLLMAECHIYKTSPDFEEARRLINLIRERAARPEGFVKEADGTTNAANYEISTYDAPFANLAEAEYALQMERKLELGQEGHRFFDLVRWGDAETEINRALNYEKTQPWGANRYGNATFEAVDVTYPIPQRQIDLAAGALVQNRQ